MQLRPPTYRSTCLLEIQPREAASHWEQLLRNRHSLAEIIRKYQLYPDKQPKLPLEEIVAAVNRGIHVQTRAGDVVAVQFEYADAALAQRVTAELVDNSIERQMVLRRNSGDQSSGTIRVLDAPSSAVSH